MNTVRIPREFMPLSMFMTALFDFVPGFLIFLGLFFWYGYTPSLHILLFPLLLVIQSLLVIGLMLLFAGWNVYFRDVQGLIPLTNRLLLYANPILYSYALLPESLQSVLALNPFGYVFEGYRDIWLRHTSPPPEQIVGVLVFSIFFLLCSYTYFRADRATIRRRFVRVMIFLKDIHKHYEGITTASRSLIDLLPFSPWLFKSRGLAANQRNEIRALDGVSLHVGRNEFVGVIGKNGSGKSTLLKLICGVVTQTSGEIARGSQKIAPIISVGGGLHPELTGIENIFLYGALLGAKKERIKERLDEIVEFSELDRFIEYPVKKLSSGMLAKLGFSVAMHLDADIYLVDEVLAVGDAAFQTKCLERFGSLKGERTVIFVSHNLHQVRTASDRVIMLDSGRVAEDGAPDKVVSAYTESLFQLHLSEDVFKPNDSIYVSNFEIVQDGKATETFDNGRPVECKIYFKNPGRLKEAVFHVSFFSYDLRIHANFNNERDGLIFDSLDSEGSVSLKLDFLGLRPGYYTVTCGIWNPSGAFPYDWIKHGLACLIQSEKPFNAMVWYPHSWEMNSLRDSSG